jgi:hypothetical protein
MCKTARSTAPERKTDGRPFDGNVLPDRGSLGAAVPLTRASQKRLEQPTLPHFDQFSSPTETATTISIRYGEKHKQDAMGARIQSDHLRDILRV